MLLAVIERVSVFFAAACRPEALKFIPTWYQYLDGKTEDGRCIPIVTTPDDAGKIVLAIIDMLLTVGGIIAIGYVIWGGIKFVMSQGNPESIKGARQTIMNALIGLVIAILASSFVTFVARSI